MELKTFISETLGAIVEGVVAAQAHAEQHGALVNPGNLMRNGGAVSNDAIWDNRNNNYARLVSFDVALVVEGTEKANAKIGVVSGLFNAKADGGVENKESSNSRIQFAIPLLLPAAAADGEARERRPMPKL